MSTQTLTASLFILVVLLTATVAAVPVPDLPASGVDEELRAAIIDDLEATAWVPTAVGKPVRPADAAVLDVRNDRGEQAQACRQSGLHIGGNLVYHVVHVPYGT